MYLSRIVIRGFRNFAHLDVPVTDKVTCVVGENNTGKTNLVFALRLALDAGMSPTFRNLSPDDFCSGTDISTPQHVLVSLEYKSFKDKPHEEGMLANCVVSDDLARITYRFRPRKEIIEGIKATKHPGTGLTIEDYRYEIRGGGAVDPATAKWNDEFGKWISFDDLQQSYLVVLMEPLRDVEQRLRQSRFSPLAKLLTSADIPEAEQKALVDCLVAANNTISTSTTISSVGTSIKKSMDTTAGKAFTMDVALGMSSPEVGPIV
jgi:putative ATP-dependent endonuclease of OLD family